MVVMIPQIALFMCELFYYMDTFNFTQRNRFIWNRKMEFIPLIFILFQILIYVITVVWIFLKYAGIDCLSVLLKIPLAVLFLVVVLWIFVMIRAYYGVRSLLRHREGSVANVDITDAILST